MVIAYWLIGREIVEDEQKGKKRAKYGKQIIEELAERVTQRYGKGFSASNFWLFRQFYLTYTNCKPEILDTVCRDSGPPVKLDMLCGESPEINKARSGQPGGTLAQALKDFSPALSWSQCRLLINTSILMLTCYGIYYRVL